MTTSYNELSGGKEKNCFRSHAVLNSFFNMAVPQVWALKTTNTDAEYNIMLHCSTHYFFKIRLWPLPYILFVYISESYRFAYTTIISTSTYCQPEHPVFSRDIISERLCVDVVVVVVV